MDVGKGDLPFIETHSLSSDHIKHRAAQSVVDVIKPLRCYAIHLTLYAASGGVKLMGVIMTLDDRKNVF